MGHVKQQVDSRLKEYCRDKIQAARDVSPRYEQLWQVIETTLTAGGKRLRPYMVLLSFHAYNQNAARTDESIMPAALAQELIHVAVLMHDDIIDRDTIRHGKKNVIGQYEEKYTSYFSEPRERQHMAEATGLLAGDILLSEAYRLLSTSLVAADALAQATAILAEGVFAVIGGELIDTENSFLPEVISPEIIARYKTAEYSFVSPLTMGAVLAEADDTQQALLKQLSLAMGIGFQLRDDLLGIFGDEAETGKSASSDLVEGKHTYLIEQFEIVASPADQKAFSELFHREVTANELSLARQILTGSGAVANVEARIAELDATSRAIIDQLAIADQYKAAFKDLLQRTLYRSL